MGAAPLLAVDSFEQPPISYSDSRPANAIEELNDRLGSGAARLVFDHSLGYLRSVLDLLQVPISSQTLVFSKTSLQQRHISPRNPRAIYFNDEVYVGFVRGGDVLELSVADPQLGTVFYTLDASGPLSCDRPTTASFVMADRRRVVYRAISSGRSMPTEVASQYFQPGRIVSMTLRQWPIAGADGTCRADTVMPRTLGTSPTGKDPKKGMNATRPA